MKNKEEGNKEMQDGISIHITRKMMIIGSIVLATIIIVGVTIFGIKAQKDSNTSGETGLGESEPTEDSNTIETSDIGTTVNSENLVVTVAPSETTSSTTTSEISGETNPESQIDYSMPPTDVVEGYLFETLSAEKQEELKRLDAMDEIEFQTLPEAEQRVLTYWIYINNKPRFEHLLIKHEITNLQYTENPQTAAEYSTNNAYMISFSGMLRTYDGGNGGLEPDLVSAKKMAIMSYSATEDHFSQWNSLMDVIMAAGDVVNPNYQIEASQINTDSVIVNLYMTSNETMTVSTDDEHFQQIYKLVTCVDIVTGKEVTISICTISLSQSNPAYQDFTSN